MKGRSGGSAVKSGKHPSRANCVSESSSTGNIFTGPGPHRAYRALEINQNFCAFN